MVKCWKVCDGILFPQLRFSSREETAGLFVTRQNPCFLPPTLFAQAETTGVGMIGLDIGISQSHKASWWSSYYHHDGQKRLKLSVYIKSMPPRLFSLYQPFPIGRRFFTGFICGILSKEISETALLAHVSPSLSFLETSRLENREPIWWSNLQLFQVVLPPPSNPPTLLKCPSDRKVTVTQTAMYPCGIPGIDVEGTLHNGIRFQKRCNDCMLGTLRRPRVEPAFSCQLALR